MTTTETEWIKARKSGDNGACVEMRHGWRTASASAGLGCVDMSACDCGINVRDSKDPDGPVLTFTKAEFAAWLDGAKKGEFDHLI